MNATHFSNILENMAKQISLNHSVNNYYVVTFFFGKVSLMIVSDPVPETYCVKFQYVRWKMSTKSMN